MKPSTLFFVLIAALGGNLIQAESDPFAPTADFSNSTDDAFGEQHFLPVEQAYRLHPVIEDGKLVAVWEIADGYYLYRHGFSAEITVGNSTQDATLDIPDGKEKQDDYFGLVQVYYHQAEATAVNIPTTPFNIAITSQGCADAGLCYPPHTETFAVDPGQGLITAATPATAAIPPNITSNANTPAEAGQSTLLMLLFALLGGATLNLMPCVFPVLSLKVLSFTSDRQHSQAIHGLVYSAGVVTSFIAVAAILVSLRAAGSAIGWGFHLQSPWFVAALAYLFFVMGLSLSGLINIGGQWMGLGNSLASAPGYAGSFFTGVLATVVASPCTAPFMGTALGFAISQPTPVALSIFAALGAGMALPMLVLSCSPALLRYMPRPGAWMDNFKQLMAFPLYATVIWLCWVVGKQTSATGMALVLMGCLLIGLAMWFWSHHILRRGISLAASIVAIWLLTSPLLTPQLKQTTSEDVMYSAESLNALRQQRQRVFINVTADWCITCLANERLTLSTDAVKQAFRDAGIVYMKGDWTNQDPLITELLNRYHRSGIPLYLMYPADPAEPAVVLPQLLTVDIVLDAIASTGKATMAQKTDDNADKKISLSGI